MFPPTFYFALRIVLVFSLGVLSQYFLVFSVYMFLSVHSDAHGTFHLFWLVCFAFIFFSRYFGILWIFWIFLLCLIGFIYFYPLLVAVALICIFLIYF